MELTPLPQARRELLVHVAAAIRDTAVDVFEATPQGAPQSTQVSVDVPSGDCCGLAVILRGFGPSGQVGSCEPWSWTSDWRLIVARPCSEADPLGSIYNIFPGQPPERPSDTLMLLDAVSIIDHFGLVVQRRVTTIVRPPMGMARGCVPYTPGRCDPYASGDCRGWRFDFRLGLSF